MFGVKEIKEKELINEWNTLETAIRMLVYLS